MSQEAVAKLFAAKAAAELADAELIAGSGGRGWRGAPLSRLAFVVSRLSAEDLAAGGPLNGATGEAAAKAAAAFGVPADAFFAIASRPSDPLSPADRSRRLVLAIEAADPAVVIALDEDAASDLAESFGVADLVPGTPARVRGRVIGAAGDLGASLADTKAKARVWVAMKAIAAEGGLKATGRLKGAPQ